MDPGREPLPGNPVLRGDSTRASGVLRPGEMIDRYRVLGLLGSGGMGTIYRVKDTASGTVYALKLLRPEIAGKPLGELQFKKEFRHQARLRHPNIVQVHEQGVYRGRWYFTMDLVEGRTLREEFLGERWAPCRAERCSRILDVVLQICSALTAIHRARLLHRDLKPQNIVITPEKRVILLDFGVARPIFRLPQLNPDSAVLATVEYIAPEQVLGRSVDRRADLYSLGVILYELIAGRLPFEAPSAREVLDAHIRKAPPALPPPEDELARRLQDATMRLLAKDPFQRYRSAEELAGFLGRTLAPAPDEAASGELRLLSPRFVDRKAELERLQQVATRARRGSASFVVLSGPEGIGKRALIQRFLTQVESAWRVFSLRIESGEDLWRQLESLFAEITGSAVRRRKPRRWEAEGLETPLPAQRRRPSLGIAHLRQYVVRRPVIIILENLERLDAVGAQILETVVCGIRPRGDRVPRRILFLGIMDALSLPPGEHLCHCFSRLERQGDLINLTLRGLDDEAIARILADNLAVPFLPRALARRVNQYAEGNPFLAQELLRGALAEGILTHRGGSWFIETDRGPVLLSALEDPASVRFPSSPESLRGVLLSRLKFLSPEAAQVLRIAAVIGDQLEFSLLQQVSGLPDDRVIDCLNELLAQELIREVPGKDDLFRFRLARIREDLMAEIPPEDLAALHQRIAEALEQQAGEGEDHPEPNRLAAHLAAAGKHLNAFDLLLSAARKARNAHRHLGAISLLKQAEQVFLSAPEEIRKKLESYHRALLLDMADSMREVGWVEQARAEFERVLSPEGAGPSRFQQGKAANGLGICAYLSGDYDQALLHFQEALEIFQELGERREIADTLNGIGGYLLSQGLFLQAYDQFRKALKVHRELKDEIGQANALNNLGLIDFLRGRLPEALSQLREAENLYLGNGSINGSATARLNLATVLVMLDEWSEARKMLQRCLDDFNELQHPEGIAETLLVMGICDLAGGDLASARSNLGQAARIAQRYGLKQVYAKTLIPFAELSLLGGQYTTAMRLAERAVGLLEPTGALGELAMALATRALITALIGRAEEALCDLRRAEGVLRRFPDAFMRLRIDVYRGICHIVNGRARLAHEHLHEAFEAASTTAGAERIAVVQALLGLAEAMDGIEEGLDRCELALAGAQEMTSPLNRLVVLLATARARTLQGGEHSAAPAETAIALAEEIMAPEILAFALAWSHPPNAPPQPQHRRAAELLLVVAQSLKPDLRQGFLLLPMRNEIMTRAEEEGCSEADPCAELPRTQPVHRPPAEAVRWQALADLAEAPFEAANLSDLYLRLLSHISQLLGIYCVGLYGPGPERGHFVAAARPAAPLGCRAALPAAFRIDQPLRSGEIVLVAEELQSDDPALTSSGHRLSVAIPFRWGALGMGAILAWVTAAEASQLRTQSEMVAALSHSLASAILASHSLFPGI
jgi:serine/threonine protein kinase/tetratricopeptide (TPR) repeat protein